MNSPAHNPAKEQLLSLLDPLAKDLSALSLSDPEASATTLRRSYPLNGPALETIRQKAEEGLADGWLTPKENGGIRFGRLAKDLHGFSVDAVLMSGPGPRHRHGNGEIDLCFSRSGEPRFDGKAPGWVVYGPGSIHTPTVSGGEMLILYFLPAGAIEFLT